MDFVVARGFSLPFPSLFDRAGFALDAAPTLIADGEVAVAASHAPVRVGTDLVVFDGHAFDGDLFVHHAHARPVDIAALHRRAPDDLGGAFCLVATTPVPEGPPTVEIVSDALGMYPLYLHRADGGRFIVSNNAHLVAAVLAASGAKVRRTFLPSLDNLVFNGPAGSPFLYEEVEVLPHGHRLSVRGGRLSVRRWQGFAAEPDAAAYAGHLEATCHQMQGAARRLIGSMPEASVVLDLTGGSDSRAMLALVLSLGLEDRIGIRNIMPLPHPDAHVAALLAEKFGLAVGPSLLPGGRPTESHFASAATEAHLHGGTRDGIATPHTTVFIDDLVSLTGFYGEIAGKWATAVAKSPSIARMSVAERVDAMFVRRRRIGQLDFVTRAGAELVRERIIAHYQGLVDQGVGPDQLEAESYLTSRCRTHFGLQSVFANRRRIQPDLLGTPWLVRARRALAPALAVDNKVIHDIVRRLGGAGLAFAPMADRRWERSVVADEDLPAWERMALVTRDTPFPGRRTERLLRPLSLPPEAAVAVPPFAVGPAIDIRYPADRTRRFSAAAVRWAIDHGGREAIGEWLDVDAILRRIDDQTWRPDGLVRSAFFDKLLPGLFWSIGTDLPDRIDRRVSVHDLSPASLAGAPAAAVRGPPVLPVSAGAEAAAQGRALLRTATMGALAVRGTGDAFAAATVAVATDPVGMPLVACVDPPPGAAVSLTLTGGRREGAALDGRHLVINGRLMTIADNDGARRRFRARHGDGPVAAGEIRRLAMEGARIIEVDGRGTPLAPADLLGDPVAAAGIAAVEPHTLGRLNRDFPDLVALLAMRLCGAGAGSWAVTGVDAWGLDLVRDDGEQARRLVFPNPVRDGPTLREMLVRLADEARAVPVPDGPPGP